MLPTSARGRALALTAAALLTAAAAVLPSLLIPLHRSFYERRFPEHKAAWPNGGPFTHFCYLGCEGEDELGHASKALEVAATGFPGDPYRAVPADWRMLTRNTLGYAYLGVLTKLTGSPERAFPFGRALLTVLYLLCLAALLRRAGCAPGPAAALAVLFTAFHDVTVGGLDWEAGLLTSLKGAARKAPWLLGGDFHFFGLTRFMRPALNYPLMALAALLVVRAFETARQGAAGWGRSAAAGAACGLLLYAHFDVWVVSCAAYGLMTAAVVWERRGLRGTGPLWVGGLLAAALSAPMLAANLSIDRSTLERTPTEVVSGFYPPSLVYAAAAVWFWRLRRETVYLWVAAVLASVSLIHHLSFVLPVTFERYYMSFVGNLWLLPAAAALAARRARDSERWWWAAALVLVAAFGRAVSYSGQVFRLYGLPQAHAGAYAWLKANAGRDAVVATLDGEVARELPLHGRCRPLAYRSNWVESDVTNEESLRRTAYALRLFVPPARRAEALDLFSRPGGQGILQRQLWTGAIAREEFRRRPAETLFAWGLFATPEYARRVENQVGVGFETVLRERLSEPVTAAWRVDYLWEGPLERSLGAGKPPAAGELVYDNGVVRLFRAEAR